VPCLKKDLWILRQNQHVFYEASSPHLSVIAHTLPVHLTVVLASCWMCRGCGFRPDWLQIAQMVPLWWVFLLAPRLSILHFVFNGLHRVSCHVCHLIVFLCFCGKFVCATYLLKLLSFPFQASSWRFNIGCSFYSILIAIPGDTMNTASRLESTGMTDANPLCRIHSRAPGKYKPDGNR